MATGCFASWFNFISILFFFLSRSRCVHGLQSDENGNRESDYWEYIEDGPRMRRYVGDPIPSLADNYYKQTTLHSKHLHSGGEEDRKLGVGGRRMEMVGNLAVPLPSLPPTTVPTERQPVKASATKKPVDPLENQKKPGDPVNYKKVEESDEEEKALSEERFIEEELYDQDTNATHFNNLIQKIKWDHHTYYNSSFIVDSKQSMEYWVDMDKEKNVVVDAVLSKSHRRAHTMRLSFDFPFYGHIVGRVMIATGGFLYMGDYIHTWLAATQYVAPLMANFDTSISPNSHIRSRDNGTSFTVEWDHVSLQDKKEAGEFSFQVTLHKSGDIVFVYRDVPMQVESIEDGHHPVKIGLSDAYIIDRTVFYVRRKTIYEYHRVNFKKEDVKNWTAIYLKALPTCIDFKDCSSCVTSKINFECKWCTGMKRCSTGFDRLRQEWIDQQCDTTSKTKEEVNQCNPTPQPTTPPPPKPTPKYNSKVEPEEYSHTMSMVGVVLAVVLITGLALWVLYAYRNPHTPSGQVLIKYRPSQWSLRRGEARYTAATIHM